MKETYLSVVIPVYNESSMLEELFSRLFPVLESLKKKYEVIFINDGSKDESIKMLKDIHQKHPSKVKVIDFNSNFGQHMAIMAGFEVSDGDVVVTMDADLQNYPEDIPKLLSKIKDGHDVVGGYRVNRKDKKWRLFVSKLHNLLRRRVTGIDMIDDGCMLRAYTKKIINYVVSTEENSTFLPALAHSFASNPVDVPVRHTTRKAGKSSYNIYKLIRYNFDFFANFSKFPLEFFTIFGLLVSFMSLCLFVYLIFKRIIWGPESEELSALFAIIYFLMGAILLGLGIVGEYIGRIYQEVRKRPRFIIREYIKRETNENSLETQNKLEN